MPQPQAIEENETATLPDAQKHIRAAIGIMSRCVASQASTGRATELVPSIEAIRHLNEALHAAREAEKHPAEYRTLESATRQ